MTGQAADFFMGSLSIVLGALALLASGSNWEGAYRFRKTQWLEKQWGRTRTRLAFAVLGAILIALGVAIVTGFAPNAIQT